MSAPIVPAVLGCRYDGVFLGRAAMFTDLEDGSPAHRGTFCVPLEEATPERLAAARDEQRARFAAATSPPVTSHQP